jgi:AcrR family transcriptional regulator
MSLEKIREEAVKQFAKKGYDGTSIKDITKEIGITAPALYAHYSSKEDLFLNVFCEAVGDLTNNIRGAIVNSNSESVDKILYSIYSAYMNEIFSMKPKSLLILRNTMFPCETLTEKVVEIVLIANRDLSSRIKSVFEQGMNEGTIKINSPDKYYRNFFKLITAHIYEILAFKVTLTRTQIDTEWEEFWNIIKKQRGIA